jgi:pimeloyl-ACP methyl ester carboxylesterase
MLEQLPRLTMPTLLIWGECDRIVPAHQARQASARLTRGQLVLLPNCGHVPQLEQPNRVEEVLSQFLKNAAVLSR